MSATITIVDETPSGERLNSFTLDDLTEEVTVREIIRARIYQEVQDYNRNLPEVFNGLVQPTDAEQTLNGYKLQSGKKISWQSTQKVTAAVFLDAFYRAQRAHLEEQMLLGKKKMSKFDETG